MITLKEIFRNIAERYHWVGYAELLGEQEGDSEIYLTSSKSPGAIPEKQTLDDAKISEILKEFSIMTYHYKDHVVSSNPNQEYSESIMNKIFAELDKILPVKNISLEDKKNSLSPIFDRCQIGIYHPIKKTAYPIIHPRYILDENGGRDKPNMSDTIHYSMIFSFTNASHLENFLRFASEEVKNLYVVYQCHYGTGSYQILIPSVRHEYEAIKLLFGQNIYTKELPVFRFLLEELRNKPASRRTYTYDESSLENDVQYSAAFDMIKKFVENEENTTLKDFDSHIGSIIKEHSELYEIFLETLHYFVNKKTQEILNQHLSTNATNTILEYARPSISSTSLIMSSTPPTMNKTKNEFKSDSDTDDDSNNNNSQHQIRRCDSDDTLLEAKIDWIEPELLGPTWVDQCFSLKNGKS